jgi:hypothetical protein
MDKLVIALGPAFAVGFAIQRLMELLDPLVNMVCRIDEAAKKENDKDRKMVVLGGIGLVVGALSAWQLDLRILAPLGVTGHGFVDGAATAVFISAGTEGFNSLLKFLDYAKENKKGAPAQNTAVAENTAAAALRAVA